MKNPLPLVVSAVVAIISYGGFISILAQSSVQAATSTVRLYVTPTTTGITAGQTTPMQLRLYKDSTAKVDYVDAKLTFSTVNLEVTSISKQGSHFSYSNGPSTSYNNSNGSISVTGTGGELPSQSDVLIATVTFKGKAAGSGSLSYTAGSLAGDMTNGGHVKNALDSRVGGVVNVSNPVSSGGLAPPSSSTPAQPSTPSTTNPDEPVSSTDPTPAADDITEPATDTSAVGSQGMSATLEQAVTKPPVWLQFLLPAAGVVGVLGMAGLGTALYLKRRASGVTLPPIEGEELGIAMPTTESTDTENPEPAFASYETADTTGEGGTLLSPDQDLGEFTAQRELDYTAPLDTIAPAPEPLDITANPSEPPFEPMLITQEPALSPPATDPLVDVPPAPAEPMMPQASEPMATPPQPLPEPEAPTVPVEQVASLPLPPEPISTPVPIAFAPETPVTPQVIGAPITNQQGGMPSTMDSVQQATSSRVAEEYADLPDMFDVGAQRLAAEGHGDLKPIGS